MDYHDNDYEDHNLHLAGEESSKVLSVLQSFTLPKFDFDDNLHHHLRFDSLVENEVFLGIPSQEDNQWIEDFSRGSGGIVFSSSATGTCALPKHNNVWSEATSSESVEMLLKAVGQEEMVPGENMVEESNLVDQLGSSTKQMDSNLKQGSEINESDYEKSSLLASEAEEDISRLNKFLGVDDVQSECMLLVHEAKILSDGMDNHQGCGLLVTSGNLHMKPVADNPGETCGLLNVPPSKQVPPVPSIRIDNIEKPSHLNALSPVEEEIARDVTGDIGFVSSGCVTECVFEAIKEDKEGDTTRGERVLGSDAETVSLDMHHPPDVPEKSESEGLAVDTHVTATGEAHMPGKGGPVSSFEGFNEVAFDIGPIGVSECGTMGFSSLEIKQLTEGRIVLPEKASTSLNEEGFVEEIAMNMNHAEDLGLSTDSSFFGEHGTEKSVIENVARVPDSITMHEDRTLIPLLSGDTQTCNNDIPSVHVDVDEYNQDVYASDEQGSKLPLDSEIAVLENNERMMDSARPDQVVQVDMVTDPYLNGSTSDFLVLDSEVRSAISTSIHILENNLADCHENRSKDMELKANEELVTSESKRSFKVADECTPSIETERCTLPDSTAALESTITSQSDFMLDTSNGSIFDEARKELNESNENPPGDLIMLEDVVESASCEKPEEEEPDKPDQISLTVIGLAKPSQSKLSKLLSHNCNDAHNIGNFLSTSLKSGVNSITKEEGAFTFDLRHLGSQSVGGSSTSSSSAPCAQACKLAVIGEGSPSTSGSRKVHTMTSEEISNVNSLMPDGNSPSGSLKVSVERKSRRGSSRSSRESVKKGNQVKETAPLRQSEIADRLRRPLSPLTAGHVMKFEGILQPRGVVSIHSSSLPDLNTSAFFQQPFTDLQQVQLRAQIFVYGSLIQGVAPDEACMVSAFDGGRSAWESTWHTCVERLHGQKGINTDTPGQSRAGASTPDQTNRKSFTRIDVLSSPATRPNNKAITSSVVNPMIALSSPLWNMSTPSCETLPSSSISRSSVFDYQAVTPMHPFQSPPVKNLVSQLMSWPAQAPFQVPWLASSQTSPYDATTNHSTFPIPESVKFTTPVKESLLSNASGTKHTSSVHAIHTGGTAILSGTSSLVDMTLSAGQTPNSKARKRKKSSGAEDVQNFMTASPAINISATAVSNQLSNKAAAVENLNQISSITQSQADSITMPVLSSHYSTSITVRTPPSFVPKGTFNQFFSSVLPAVSGVDYKSGDLGAEKRALNIDEFSKVEEAKLQAEEASAHAAAAVRNCQVLWIQLEQQNKSGLTSEIETKLASAAVAIAAAASVAKAASAAAKIASSTAMQAKQMADEATSNYGSVDTLECDTVHPSSSSSYIASSTPVSILKGAVMNHPSTFLISAAREAAKRRVEAVSAAARHAENLDAILKAAELAADAVSQAGKILTMGDPLPLSELLAAGPDGYWKISQEASVPESKVNKENPEKSNTGDGSTKDMLVTSCREMFRNNLDYFPIEESPGTFIKHGQNSSKSRKDKNVQKSAETISLVSESCFKSIPTCSEYESASIIKEGSLVEVFKDHSDSKKAWYLANILSLKDGEALVCYANLQSDQGPEPLKEWVTLEAKDGNPSIVRIPHPLSIVQFEGARKRRRGSTRDNDWCVGDKVDAWVQDCWREGIIAENSKKDATALNVHFPAQGETLAVKVWHLRPTVMWIDGQWIEWGRTGPNRISQGDTPNEKRPKLESTVTETKGKGKALESFDFCGIRKNEESKLPLSSNEKAFNIGSTSEVRPSAARTIRSGLQKEGSKGVVIGVPKPGKKRKFMEVSKHYVSNRSTKTNVPSDSVKLSNFLTPHGSGSSGWKNKSSVDLKERQTAEVKPKGLKFEKPPTIPSRTFTRKDDSTTSRLNAGDAMSLEVKGSISIDDIESTEQMLPEFGSLSNASEDAVVFSSQALPPANRKKKSSMNAKSERFNKGKHAPDIKKTAKGESNENISSDSAEPRRSNRRIQPTSRLLEGLQSSLTISKLPSSAQEKGNSKGASRGNNIHS